jgi:hypothetical protein
LGDGGWRLDARFGNEDTPDLEAGGCEPALRID